MQAGLGLLFGPCAGNQMPGQKNIWKQTYFYCFFFFKLTFVRRWPLLEAVKDAVYSLGIECMVLYLFSLLKSGQRKMVQNVLHYPCSTSAAPQSCGEVTALMECIQKPTTNMHGNRCYKIAERKCLAITLWHGYLALAASWPSPTSSLRRVKRREVHFGTGNTCEARQDL